MNARQFTAAMGAIALAGATFAAGSWFGAARARSSGDWDDGRLLSTAIESVRANALDSLPSEELVRRAVTGMLRELHDPYAAMLRPDSYKSYRGTLHGAGLGLGLSLRRQAGDVTVARVAIGSPAAGSGIRNGDRVLSVNGVPIADGWGRPVGDTASALPDTARVILWRASLNDTISVGVRRGDWHMPAVTDAALLGDTIGYVRLSSITSRSSEELEDAVALLHRRGARALMLDLRGNGGGLFDEGVRAAGLFLPRGALIASLAGRGGVRPEEHRSKSSRWPTMPLTVLVDGGTASAAEVIAAALRDHNRALLVGTPTYGKGVVQRVVKLTPEISLRLTTARWLTPNGNMLERRQGKGAAARGGLLPDVRLDDATRGDPFGLPQGISGAATMALSHLADSLTARALRENWTTSPLSTLEAHFREVAAAEPAPQALSRMSRADWVNAVTRLATVRLLEVEQAIEPLLRYSTRTDAALRAGLDVLAPGLDVAPAIPLALPPLSRPEPRARTSQP